MKRFLILLMLLASAVACSNKATVGGRDPATEPPIGATSGSTPRATPGTARPTPGETPGEPGHEGESPGTKHLSEMYDRNNPPPSGFRRADSGESRTGNERLDLLVRIQPGCVEMGSLVTFTAKTKPDVSTAFLVNVPDEQGRAREEAGRSDREGLFTWTLRMPTTNIREGQYTLFAAAADDQGTDGGISGKWFFVVAVPDACP